MKNPFKEILSDEKLPEVIKQRVMADIAVIRLSVDIADLFVVKYPEIFNDILKNKTNESTDEPASDSEEIK